MKPNYMRPEITPGLRASMNRVGAILDQTFKGHGFALFVFPLNGEDGLMNWLSNADREDMFTALREFIAVNEGRAHEPPKEMQ